MALERKIATTIPSMYIISDRITDYPVIINHSAM